MMVNKKRMKDEDKNLSRSRISFDNNHNDKLQKSGKNYTEQNERELCVDTLNILVRNKMTVLKQVCRFYKLIHLMRSKKFPDELASDFHKMVRSLLE